MILPSWLIIICIIPLFFISIIIFSKNTFFFPYVLLTLIMLESFPLFRIASNAMGDYLSIPRIVTFVFLLSLLFAPKNKPKFKSRKVISIAFIFVIYFTTSALWSITPTHDFTRLMTFPMLFVSLWMVARITEDRRTTRHFLNAMILMGLFISLFSVLAFLGIGYYGRYGLTDETIGLIRTRPFNLNSNQAAYYIAICSIPLFASYLNRITIWKKLSNRWIILFIILNFAGVLATSSISSVVLLLIIGILSYILSPGFSRRIAITLSGGLLIIIMAVFFNLRSGFIDNIFLRKYLIETEVVGLDTEFLGGVYGGRGQFWSDAYDMFLSNPIVGCGLSSFNSITGKSTHNDILWALAEGGFIGLMLWLSLIYSAFKVSNHIRKISYRTQDPHLILWSNTLFVFIVASFAYSQLHAVHINKLFWVFLGLVAGISGTVNVKYLGEKTKDSKS